MIRVILRIDAFGEAEAEAIVASLMRSLRFVDSHKIEFTHITEKTQPPIAIEALVVTVSQLTYLRGFEEGNYPLTPKWRLECSKTLKFQTLKDMIEEFQNLPEQVFKSLSSVLYLEPLSKYVNEDFLRKTLILLREAYWHFRNIEQDELAHQIGQCFSHIQRIAFIEHSILNDQIKLQNTPATARSTDDILKDMKSLQQEVWKLVGDKKS